jgi:putative N6-adenine-specific DNA methylase
MNDLLNYFAAAIPGTEGALCEELRELGFQSVRLNRGGIPFRGTREDGWRACLETRIAQRVQVLLERFPAETDEALYTGIQRIDWSAYLTLDKTLSITAICRGSKLTHSGFVALKAKDAIIDQVRTPEGARPSVDREDADVRVVVYIVSDKASIYVDLSGPPLHRRGYRQETGEAPLRETLAAAMLRLSGWDRETPLMDPMCGSGTLAIEAAQWTGKIAPGLLRDQFGFERWADFQEEDAETLRHLKGELRRNRAGTSAKILASDQDSDMLDLAKRNARAAGVKLSFKERSFFDFQVTPVRTHIVTNPPYGQRMTLDPEFVREFAAAVHRMHGWRVSILAGNPAYKRAIPVPVESAIPIKNGDLECELLNYEVP